MRKILLFSLSFALMFTLYSGGSSASKVTSGNLITIKDFKSNYVASRNVHVWLPEQYAKSTKRGEKFAVLYMHDGQMLFDRSSTWNGQAWGVDAVASALLEKSKLRHFIVVGIDNGGATLRHAEYFPQKPFESLSSDKRKALYQGTHNGSQSLFSGNKVQSDEYLKFIVTELKPYIDTTYNVHTDPENTYLMGSSMGGLISLYAISEYPDVFGAAACLSTHWPGDFDSEDQLIPQAFFSYMEEHLPTANNHRIYFDHGTATLDAKYPALQKRADAIMRDKGYDSNNWQTLTFEGAAHTEDAWNARLPIPLIFLLGQ
ncbi:putative protein YbbA [Paraglaciecola mesophila]|uniref:Esterase n=1 Tax=Paraglaciecola mesophila TaxID=197222 RepID=A0A857JG01_9ALTE|nr:alpha/beta fold hydrolase [Paraglaciecola mesophila]QHJ10118.1 putative protein YbbA [Paraglaciecola mesophila]